MVTYEEAKKNFFAAQIIGEENNAVDDEQAYLFNQLSVSTGNSTDLWYEWFRQQGYTKGSLADRWWAFLVASGYTQGHLREKQKKYFEDNS